MVSIIKIMSKYKSTVFLVNINNDMIVNGDKDRKYLWNRYISLNKYNMDDFITTWTYRNNYEFKLLKDGESTSFQLNIDDLNPEMVSLMKRGDMVENLYESGYRSQGVYFYDGEQLIDQRRDYDDYGSPPHIFKIIEDFPPDYWDNPIVNNHFVNSDDESQFYWHSTSAVSEIDLSDYDIKISDNNDKYIKKEITFEYEGCKYIYLFSGEFDCKKYPKHVVSCSQDDKDKYPDYDYVLRDDS